MRKLNKIMCLIMCLILIFPMSVTANENEDNKDYEKIYVNLGGEPFGIKMYTDGVYILKTESFINKDGIECCPAEEAQLKSNDVIKKANNVDITTNDELKEIIENSKGEEINLVVDRNREIIDLSIKPQKSDDGSYKTGMWIKDSAAGLGTISFYSEKLGGFCGLGHGMCDAETNKLIPVTSGEADYARVTTVTKSTNGNVGSLNGYFTNEKIGEFTGNNDTGIYGKLTTNINNNLIEIAKKNDISRGNAKLYTTIEGEHPRYYDINIVMIKKGDKKINLVIKITDEELLNSTGGVVQGMSGSPIIQNGKLVGVLTHVVVNNVDYGYGIFAQTMYEELEKAS